MWVLSGMVMISRLSYFSLISPSSPFSIFLCRMAVERGRRRIRTAMALLQTVIYGRPAVGLSLHEIKDDLGRNLQPWGSRAVSSFLWSQDVLPNSTLLHNPRLILEGFCSA